MAAVPSPADAPTMTAEQLLRRVRLRGGRIFRMAEFSVFVLTTDKELALWLLKLGGKRYTPAGADPSTPDGSYRLSAEGRLEWDVYVHAIPVLGEQTVWEAAETANQILNAEDAA